MRDGADREDIQGTLLGRVVGLAGAVLVIASLYLGREVLIPVALAVFFSFLLAPAVRAVERLRLRRVAAVLLIAAASFGIIGGLGWLVISEAVEVVQQLPQHRENIVSKIQTLRASVEASLAGATATVGQISAEIENGPTSQTAQPDAGAESNPLAAADSRASPEGIAPGPTASAPTELQSTAAASDPEPVKVEVVSPMRDMFVTLAGFILPAVHPLATIGVASILIVFFLIYQEDLRDRFVRLCGKARVPMTTATLSDSAKRVTRFIVAQTIANGLIGLAIGTGLYALSIPNAALWGFMAGIFRFIPYIGAIVAGFFPAILSFAIFDGWLHPLLVVGLVLLVDQLSANFLEPWLYGVRTGVSPTAILFAALFWTWLWGLMGLFLATPITVFLVVLGKHSPSFELFYILLGDEPVLEPQVRFYQRLLAKDAKEAATLAQSFIKETSLIDACDQVILPALAQLELDRRGGVLDTQRMEFAHQTVKELMESLPDPSLSDEEVEQASSTAEAPFFAVTGDRGDFDGLIGIILARALQNRVSIHPLSQEALASEIAEQVNDLRPAGLVLAAIEPRDIPRIRHVCLLLRGERATECPIHVALFSTFASKVQRHRRAVGVEPSFFHTTLAELVEGMRRSAVAPLAASRAQFEAPSGLTTSAAAV